MLFLTGALTSKSYAFTSRPWELKSVQSIDILDGIGSNIRIDFKESEIVRILPRKNFDINENWISDKIRFFYDGLQRQRLLTPFFKQKGKLFHVEWKNLSSKLSSLFKVYSFEYGSSKIGILTGSSIETESMYSLKDLALNYGFSNIGFENQIKINADNSKTYKFQSPIKDLEGVDYCLFLGTNPRFEASTLNLRLKKIHRRVRLSYSSVGGNFVPTFPIDFFGLTPLSILQLAEGKHQICKAFVKAKKPSIIYGVTVLERFDSLGLQNLLKFISTSCSKLFKKTLPINLLQKDANLVGALELGFKSLKKDSLNNLKFVYAVGLNQKKTYKELEKMSGSLLVFQNSIGDHYTNNADVVLPSTAFVETNGTYYNTEGRPQRSQLALIGPNLSKDNWKIASFVFDLLGKTGLYSKRFDLEKLITHILPSFFFLNTWFLENYTDLIFSKFHSEFVYSSLLKLPIEDFFMTHNFCSTSKVMAKASKSFRQYTTNYKFLRYI